MNNILTANERIVTKNAQAAQNHCILHIVNVASTPANKTITDEKINTLDTNKSASATLAIKALPENMVILIWFYKNIHSYRYI